MVRINSTLTQEDLSVLREEYEKPQLPEVKRRIELLIHFGEHPTEKTIQHTTVKAKLSKVDIVGNVGEKRGVSVPTIYRWIGRFKRKGIQGLIDQHRFNKLSKKQLKHLNKYWARLSANPKLTTLARSSIVIIGIIFYGMG